MIIIIICSIVIFYVYFRVIYDVLLGYFCFGGWGNWFNDIKYYDYLDFMCILGILLGVIFRLFMLV